MNLKQFNSLWPKLGGFFAVIIFVVVLILWNQKPEISKLSLLFWLNLVVLMLHEFEEYVFPGGFKHFINQKTFFTLPNHDEIFGERTIVIINLGIWLLIILSALLAEIAPWFGLGLIIFNFVNILGHLVLFQTKSPGYNPGTVTAILMIPFLVIALKFVIEQSLISPIGYILAIVIGFLSGISLPVSGFLIRRRYQKNHQ